MHKLYFCGLKVFDRIHPMRYDLERFGVAFTKDWGRRLSKNFEDGHMNCLVDENGFVMLSVPNIDDTTYLRINWDRKNSLISVSYPSYDAKSFLHTMYELYFEGHDPINVDGVLMKPIEALALASMTVAMGRKNGKEIIIYDMIQDGEFDNK